MSHPLDKAVYGFDTLYVGQRGITQKFYFHCNERRLFVLGISLHLGFPKYFIL
jgi:hypothetical protein